jgi:predicted TIM-barrel fold metal-dependent hydrolase
MRTIAIEEHFLSNEFRSVISKNAARGGGSNAYVTSTLAEKLVELGSTRLKSMAANNIDFQVISHMASGITPTPGDEGLVRSSNDHLAAAISAHPKHFAGFAMLPMSNPDAAINELERAVRVLGFKGAMINGTAMGLFLDDPSFFPILERAVVLDVPLYIHPAAPPAVVREAYYSGFDPAVDYMFSTAGWGWHAETGVHALRLILSGVFDRLPKLQIIIGHMGEMLPFMLARVDNTITPLAKNLKQKVSDYFLQNFFITTSGFFTNPPFLLALQIMGEDRIIFSVDYPYSSNEQGRAFLDNMSVGPSAREKICHLNVERLLKL